MFEGSEKKIEIVFSSSFNAKTFFQKKWPSILQIGAVKILSHKSDGVCEAYLLSESSLFVWERKILIITCGFSKLISIVEEILKMVPKDCIDFLNYQRKNEYLPHSQKTSFQEDIKVLNSYLDGEAFFVGKLDGHHMFVYSLNKKYQSEQKDYTFEILMYDVQTKYSFSKVNSPENISQFLNLKSIFKHYVEDSYVFSPQGYSLNGFYQDRYYTMHVTPEEPTSYVSFETNSIFSLDEAQHIFSHLIRLFQPYSVDFISYVPLDHHQGKDTERSLMIYEAFKDMNYLNICSSRVDLNKSYELIFQHFFNQSQNLKWLEKVPLTEL